jgi:hypothetical protein
LILFRQQAKLIDARGADFVHHRDNVAVLGSSIALYVDSFVKTGGQHVFNLPGDVFLGDLGLLTLAISTGRLFCNIGVTTIKMISRTSMMSAIGMTFGAAI